MSSPLITFAKSQDKLQTLFKSMVMSLNPFSPVNLLIFVTIMCITSFHVLKRDVDGSHQWAKASHYTLPLYGLIATLINGLLVIYFTSLLPP